jgi:hypothetical protein
MRELLERFIAFMAEHEYGFHDWTFESSITAAELERLLAEFIAKEEG